MEFWREMASFLDVMSSFLVAASLKWVTCLETFMWVIYRMQVCVGISKWHCGCVVDSCPARRRITNQSGANQEPQQHIRQQSWKVSASKWLIEVTFVSTKGCQLKLHIRPKFTNSFSSRNILLELRKYSRPLLRDPVLWTPKKVLKKAFSKVGENSQPGIRRANLFGKRDPELHGSMYNLRHP